LPQSRSVSARGLCGAPASPSSASAPREWVEVFDLFTDGRIPRECGPADRNAHGEDGLSARDAAAAEGIEIVDRSSGSAELDDLTMDGYLREKGDTPDKRLRFLAGSAIDASRGRAPAKDVAQAESPIDLCVVLREKIEETSHDDDREWLHR
jgi:hypothetical protein